MLITIVKIGENKKALGGLLRLELILESDIVQMPVFHPFYSAYQGSIVLKDGAQPIMLYFQEDAQSTTNNIIGNRAGDAYKETIKCRSPRFHEAALNFIRRAANNRVAVVYQDRLGKYKIVRQCRVSITSGTGATGGFNGATWTFASELTKPALTWNYTDNPYIIQVGVTAAGAGGTNASALPDAFPQQTAAGEGGTNATTIGMPQCKCLPPVQICNCNCEGNSNSNHSTALLFENEYSGSTWTVQHNLNTYQLTRPTLLTLTGYCLFTEDLVQRVRYVDENTLVVHLRTAIEGVARVQGFYVATLVSFDFTAAGQIGNSMNMNVYKVTVDGDYAETDVWEWFVNDALISVTGDNPDLGDFVSNGDTVTAKVTNEAGESTQTFTIPNDFVVSAVTYINDELVLTVKVAEISVYYAVLAIRSQDGLVYETVSTHLLEQVDAENMSVVINETIESLDLNQVYVYVYKVVNGVQIRCANPVKVNFSLAVPAFDVVTAGDLPVVGGTALEDI